MPIIQRCFNNDFSLDDYIAFLQQAYHHVKFTVPLLMATGAKLTEDKEWLREAYKATIESVGESQYWANERKIMRLPSYFFNGDVNEHIERMVKAAEKHYTISIAKLALRIEKKGLNQEKIEMTTGYVDVNITTTITDGEKVVKAWTIIAGGEVQKPHYRYLVK